MRILTDLLRTGFIFLLGAGLISLPTQSIAATVSKGPSKWYFHTGEGYYEGELTSSDGEVLSNRVSCELSEFDPDCKELVYYFTKSEILNFVNMARDLYEERINNHETNIGIGVLVASWASRTAFGAFLVPDPTISKLTGILAGLLSAASAAYTTWEGLKLSELYDIVGQVDDLMTSEQRYVNRCGHVRSSFNQDLLDLGVQLIFSTHGGTLVSSQSYFAALKKEEQALKQIDENIRGGMSEDEAQRIYEQSCDQVPVIENKTQDKSYDYIGNP